MTNQTENVQAKILSLSLGDSKMEATLASLYYKNVQELKDLYAVGLIKQDPELIRFIRHKYQSAFRMLGLSALEAEVNGNGDKDKAEDTIQAQVERVGALCDELLSQLLRYYPWLEKGSS